VSSELGRNDDALCYTKLFTQLFARKQSSVQAFVKQTLQSKKRQAKGSGVLNRAESLRKRWAILQCFELGLGVRIVIADVGSAVSFGYPWIRKDKPRLLFKQFNRFVNKILALFQPIEQGLNVHPVSLLLKWDRLINTILDNRITVCTLKITIFSVISICAYDFLDLLIIHKILSIASVIYIDAVYNNDSTGLMARREWAHQ